MGKERQELSLFFCSVLKPFDLTFFQIRFTYICN